MNEVQRKQLEKLTKDLEKYDQVHKKWIEYTKAYQVIAFIVALITLIFTIIGIRGI